MLKKILTISICFILFLHSKAQTYDEIINKAIDYQEAKDYIGAEQALKEALRKEPANPSNALLLSNLGTIQRILGKYEDALLSYNVALSKHPNTISILQNRAALYCEIDSLNKAMQDYNTILLLEENNMEALYRRSLIALEKKDILSAQVDIDKMKEINPDNYLANSGQALLLKRQKNWNKAEEVYSDLIYKHKSEDDLYLNRAECYLEMGKLARTQEDLNKASSLGNNTPLLHILKGRLRLEQYDKHTAKTDFLKAKELGADEVLINDLLKLCK